MGHRIEAGGERHRAIVRHALKVPFHPVESAPMKWVAAIARIGTFLLASALVLAAEPVSQLHPTGYVNDFAHVLDQGTITQLDDVCRQIDDKAHAQIAVVTINSLDGSPIEDYSVDLFQKWGVGNKATNRGVLILLAVHDHRYRVEVGYGLEPILTDGKVGSFGREAVPLLRQNDYNGALSLMTSRVADVIAQDAGVQLTGTRTTPQPQEEPESGFPMSALIFIIIIVVLSVAFRLWGGGYGLYHRGIRRAWIGGGFGGWGGGFGGGGFGGGFGGGGGGFGGFGGGMSGGGGASGGW
jgi:uncharacterized protein